MKGFMRAKKMTEEVVKKEVDFGDIELSILKPQLKDDKSVAICGNFTEVGAKIAAVVARYKDVKLTQDNIDYVKTLKKQFASLRLGIEKNRKEYLKIYIDPAKDLLNAMCKELLQSVEQGESVLEKQIDEYDEERKQQLTSVLQEYVQDASEKFKLREEYASKIVLLDKYYNKTQKEEDSIADIENQAKELAAKQADYDNAVVLITAECEEADLLSASYIRELEYKSMTEIILEIKHDKKLNASLKQKAASGEKIVLGKNIEDELRAEMNRVSSQPEENRTRILRIVYTAENAQKIAKALKELCVSFEFIKTQM